MKIEKGAKYIGIGISILTLSVFIYIYGPFNLLRTLSSLPSIFILFFIAALAFHLLSFIFWSFRIKFLSFVNGYKITFYQAFITVISSLFIATLTPGYIGGEPVRIKKLNDYGIPAGSSTAIVLGERGFDSIFFILIFTFIILSGFVTLTYEFHIYAIIGIVVLIVFLAFLVLSIGAKNFFKVLIEKIEKFLVKIDKKGKRNRENFSKVAEGIELFADSTKTMFIKKPAMLVAGVLITSLLWLSDFSVPVILIMGFGIRPDIIYILFIQVILVLISLIPITPGAAGIMEILMLATFAAFLPHNYLVIFIIIWRFITFYFNILLGSFSIHKIVTK